MTDPTAKPSADKTAPEPGKATKASSTTPASARAVEPYEKPVIRKYDQIDQVRPYGPSEI